jgi:hypothetical protein
MRLKQNTYMSEIPRQPPLEQSIYTLKNEGQLDAVFFHSFS